MLQPQNLDIELVKAGFLIFPILALLISFVFYPPRYFERVGMMLGVLLNIPYILLLNQLAIFMGWWQYSPGEHYIFGVPPELLIGWVVFWGAFLPHVFRGKHSFLAIVVAAMIDLWFMPIFPQVFKLGQHWLVGEGTLLCLCLLPSLWIYTFTVKRKFVVARVLLQSYIWGGWIVFIIPAIALSVEGKNIFDIFSMPFTRISTFTSFMLCSMSLGYWAVLNFALKGYGTPIPFDPPLQLVTSGIYRYLANPMQVSTLLMFLCLTWLYQSWVMLYPILCLVLYSEFLVRWHHSVDIQLRFGNSWLEYRRRVRNWLPTFNASC